MLAGFWMYFGYLCGLVGFVVVCGEFWCGLCYFVVLVWFVLFWGFWFVFFVLGFVVYLCEPVGVSLVCVV